MSFSFSKNGAGHPDARHRRPKAKAATIRTGAQLGLRCGPFSIDLVARGHKVRMQIERNRHVLQGHVDREGFVAGGVTRRAQPLESRQWGRGVWASLSRRPHLSAHRTDQGMPLRASPIYRMRTCSTFDFFPTPLRPVRSIDWLVASTPFSCVWIVDGLERSDFTPLDALT